MSFHSHRSFLTAIALGLLGSTAAAQSLDGEAFAERLKAVSEEQGTPLAYDSVATEGETVVLSGVSVGEGDTTLDLGEVRFETVSGSDADGWRVERVPFEDVDTTDEETRTLVRGMVIEGLSIAPDGGEDAAVTDLQFERMGLANLSIERNGEEAFRLAGFDVTNQPGEAGGFSAEFGVEEFFVDTTVNAESDGAAVMSEIGYPQLTGDMSGSATWDTASGELSLAPLLLRVEDAGELSLAYTITGYTPDFVQSLAQLQQQMAADPESQAGGMAMIGLISQLYLNSAEIVFEDGSLTERLLDYYAGENGQSRDELLNSLVGMLPLALGYLNNPEFQAEVSEAVEAFLRDPQSLTIAVSPPEPVPATQIVGAAMGAPQTLPAVLDLTVTSNE